MRADGALPRDDIPPLTPLISIKKEEDEDEHVNIFELPRRLWDGPEARYSEPQLRIKGNARRLRDEEDDVGFRILGAAKRLRDKVYHPDFLAGPSNRDIEMISHTVTVC